MARLVERENIQTKEDVDHFFQYRFYELMNQLSQNLHTSFQLPKDKLALQNRLSAYKSSKNKDKDGGGGADDDQIDMTDLLDEESMDRVNREMSNIVSEFLLERDSLMMAKPRNP